VSDDATFVGYHFTSYDNPLLDPEEIEAAKKSMSAFSFRQEFMASFEAQGSELFKEEYIKFSEEEPEQGQFYIAVDLAGFADVAKVTTKTKRLDQTAISVVKASEEGWWVANIIHGRWGVEETARRIFQAVRDYQPVAVGIEKGALKNAVLPYLNDQMKKNQRFFRVDALTHGNKKKTDRIVWALQGRFEHGNISLNKGEWNSQFLDELFQFPNQLVHDDLIDSLSYIDQLANIAYTSDFEEEEYQLLDTYAGY
jgi:predicted phage terminase large subunit-like protein